ncbi:MAG: Wzz/FepE/Etk N-terminal domain-containing protein [Pseudomonadota bacterium]
MNAAAPPVTPDLRDVFRALVRRRLPASICLATGLVVAMLLALLLPARYQSTATILIEQQELPADLVRSTVTSFADQRIQVISQRVMTTETLLKLINKFNLYAKDRASETREELISRMRSDIDFHMISADVIDPRSGRPTAATIAFAVSYTSREPELAVRVANDLTSLYLNENLSQRARLAEDASAFLREEGDRINTRITVLETDLAKFKEENADTLPELAQFNLELLDRTEQQIRTLEAQQSSLDQQRVFLEAQLAQLKPNSAVYSETGERILSANDRLKTLRSQLASAQALYAPDHPDIARLRREIAGLEQSNPVAEDYNDITRRLEETRAAQAAASNRYGPEHPDRVRLDREVAALEAKLAATAPAAAPGAEFRPVSGDNPAFVQIQAQLSANINDRRSLNAQIGQMRKEILEYRRKISVSPQIEKQYREMSRDYDNARAKYQDVRAKQMEAQTAQNLETDRKGERFTLIEPPMMPEKPVSPNRGALLVLGIALSSLLAAGLVFALERFDSTVRGRKDLLQLLGVAPLAIVPRIVTAAGRGAARRRFRYTTAAAAVLSCALALTSLHVFLRPLDSLWFAVIRKLGI